MMNKKAPILQTTVQQPLDSAHGRLMAASDTERTDLMVARQMWNEL